jgi:uncharacterized protein (TIGR02996 family)
MMRPAWDTLDYTDIHPTEIGFIQALNESPDDESLHLIYCDWREEHDDYDFRQYYTAWAEQKKLRKEYQALARMVNEMCGGRLHSQTPPADPTLVSDYKLFRQAQKELAQRIAAQERRLRLLYPKVRQRIAKMPHLHKCYRLDVLMQANYRDIQHQDTTLDLLHTILERFVSFQVRKHISDLSEDQKLRLWRQNGQHYVLPYNQARRQQQITNQVCQHLLSRRGVLLTQMARIYHEDPDRLAWPYPEVYEAITQILTPLIQAHDPSEYTGIRAGRQRLLERLAEQKAVVPNMITAPDPLPTDDEDPEPEEEEYV